MPQTFQIPSFDIHHNKRAFSLPSHLLLLSTLSSRLIRQQQSDRSSRVIQLLCSKHPSPHSSVILQVFALPYPKFVAPCCTYSMAQRQHIPSCNTSHGNKSLARVQQNSESVAFESPSTTYMILAISPPWNLFSNLSGNSIIQLKQSHRILIRHRKLAKSYFQTNFIENIFYNVLKTTSKIHPITIRKLNLKNVFQFFRGHRVVCNMYVSSSRRKNAILTIHLQMCLPVTLQYMLTKIK